MPEPLRLSEVNNRVQNLTLPQLERYIINLLPTTHPVDAQVIAQGLWNTRNMGGFEPEYQAQWNGLLTRLKATYQVMDDLAQKEHDHEMQRGEELNDQLRQRAELQKSIYQGQTQPRRDFAIEQPQGGSGVDQAPLIHGPQPREPKDPVPGVLKAAGFWAARKAANAAKKTGQAAVNAWNSPSDMPTMPTGPGAPMKVWGPGKPINISDSLLVWVALVVMLGLHLWLALEFGFKIPGVFYFLALIVVPILWWAANRFDASEFKSALIITTFACGLYLFAAYSDTIFSNTDITDGAVVAVTFFPVWVIAMWARLASRSENSAAGFLLRGYLFLWVCLLLVFVIWPIVGSKLGALPALGNQADVAGSTKGFFELLIERWNRVTNRLGAIGSLYTNPNYYTGTVDDNQGKPLGVTLSDLRPLDEEISNDTAITLFANVETKSFVGESAQIVPSCVIDRSRAEPSSIDIDPPVLDVVYGTTGSFECSFEPPLGGWRAGVYGVTASATFPFQTWAYIPYTFVDEERARNIARQGQDLRDVLDIDQDADAVYTSGPVAMGMGGTGQPILVRRDDAANAWLAPGSRIGVTLDSGWQDGEITHVQALELKVPEGFVLTDCDRDVTATSADPNAIGYTTYTFENPPDTSVAVDYLTITCKLGLVDAEAASNLVAAGDKAERTFVAVARYEYTTEEKDSVRVR